MQRIVRRISLVKPYIFSVECEEDTSEHKWDQVENDGEEHETWKSEIT